MPIQCAEGILVTMSHEPRIVEGEPPGTSSRPMGWGSTPSMRAANVAPWPRSRFSRALLAGVRLVLGLGFVLAIWTHSLWLAVAFLVALLALVIATATIRFRRRHTP